MLHLVTLVLAAFRLQRIFTADSWYPTQAFRQYLARRASPAIEADRQNFWTEAYELFSCPWCFGFWSTVAVFTVDHFYSHPFLTLAFRILAASALVGLIGSRLDGDD